VPQIAEPFQSLDYREEVSESEGTGVEKELDEAMRRAILKIFQLVRPEKLFLLHQEVPDEYKRFTLLGQEHFSCLVFLKMLMNSLLATIEHNSDNSIAQEASVTSKWCIYTRTSPELFVLADKQKGDRFIEALEMGDRAVITMYSLSEFLYSNDCSAAYETWKVGATNMKKLHVLLFVIDVATVSPFAVNFASHLCDKGGNPGTNCLFVLLLHFPPEVAFLGLLL
jgi:hypothetical protein